MISRKAAVLRRETKLLGSEPSVWVLFAVYTALLGYGALQGAVLYRNDLKQISKTREEYDSRWRRLSEKAVAATHGGAEQVWGSWRSASLAGSEEGGSVAWLNPRALSVLDRGYANRNSFVRRVSLYDSPAAPPLANPTNVMYGSMDFAFVVLWILPIVSILLAFQAIGRDRELGVWPLILASGVSLRKLVAVRLAIPALLISSVTVIGGCVTVLPASGVFPLPLILWATAVLLYCAFWTLLAGWIGLAARSSVFQLLLLGAVWAGAVWVVPGVLESVAEVAVPRVSPVQGIIASRQAQTSLAEKAKQLTQQIYNRHPDWIPDLELTARMNQPVPGGPRRRDARNVYASYLAGEEASSEMTSVKTTRDKAIATLVNRLSVFSPLVSMQFVSEELAGTSPARYEWFAEDAERFSTRWRAFFAERVWRLQEMDASAIEQRPAYSGSEEPWRSVLSRMLWPITGGFIWLSAVTFFFMLKLRSFLPV